MLRAMPQINGNTRDDFAAAYSALVDAEKAVRAAIAKVSCDITNGRNYQHLGSNGPVVAEEDRKQVRQSFQTVLDLLDGMASDIADACNGGA